MAEYIENWRVANKYKVEPYGCERATIYTDYGSVAVFSAPRLGWSTHEQTEPFTSLEMVLGDRVYRRRIPRQYHHRWLARLAHQFAFEAAHQDAAEQ